jgi:hypothetical protein
MGNVINPVAQWQKISKKEDIWKQGIKFVHRGQHLGRLRKDSGNQV